MTWATAVTDPLRVVDYRAEAVSVSGQSLGVVPVDGVRIDYDGDRTEAVSYTHLTLPTSDLV